MIRKTHGDPISIAAGLLEGGVVRLTIRCQSVLGFAFIASSALVGLADARAVDIVFVEVGDAGNAAAFNGFGSVDDVYFIGETEITNAEFAEFLNTVDPTGANEIGLYNANMTSNSRGGIDFVAGNAVGFKYQPKANFGSRPVNYVSWYDAARFANWMHNGQGLAGTTEGGSYDMTLETPVRLPGASIALPNDDEWFKAAYFDPTKPYWLFPTQSDSTPTSAMIGTDGSIINPGANVANWDSDATVSVVATAGNTGQYGTFDQCGNVSEWTEGISGTNRGDKGGDWTGGSIRSDDFGALNGPTNEGSTRGFRLVMVPEPGSVLLSIIALAAIASLRCNRSFRRVACQSLA